MHSAVDTSGIADARVVQAMVDLVDLWLFDVKVVDPDKHMVLVGCSNQPALENLRSLARLGSRIWARVPLIPGINDGPDDLRSLAGLLKSLAGGQPEQVDLLPYHLSGIDKYTPSWAGSMRSKACRSPMPNMLSRLRVSCGIWV